MCISIWFILSTLTQALYATFDFECVIKPVKLLGPPYAYSKLAPAGQASVVYAARCLRSSIFFPYEHRRADRGARPISLTRRALTLSGGGERCLAR
jgi:hypothetical protein